MILIMLSFLCCATWGGSGALYLQSAAARWNSLSEACIVRPAFGKWCW